MSTDTPEQRAETSPEWAPLPPAAPKPPRDPMRIALVAGGVTLAVILIATTIFALRGQSRPTTANTAAPTVTTAPTATTASTATTAPTATPAPGTAPAAPLSVYVASSDNSSGVLKIVALNPSDGSVRWQNDSLRGSPYTPAVGGNRIFVLVGNGPLIAFQALDGKELWRVAHPSVGAAPVLDGDVLFTAARGSVTAYSTASGAVLWQKDFGPNASVHMDASGGTLYLSLGFSFEALRGSDGSVLWQQSSSTLLEVPPVVVDGTLYFNDFGEVFAFNPADGSPRWHYRSQQPVGEGANTLAVGEGLVFAGDGTSVVALHVADGTLAWSKAYPRLVFATSYSNGMVYVSWEDPSLSALRASDGSQLWTALAMSSQTLPEVVVAGNTVFVSKSPGLSPTSAPAYVYALRPTDGSVIWLFTATSAGFVSAPVVA